MELYTLTRGFFPKEFISEFTSLIWTERYSSAGDMQLVVDPIPSVIEALAPGTLLGLRGVKEIMMVENQSIENGLLTVTGSSLVKFLNQREAWFPNPDYDGTDTTVNLSADYKATETIGQFLADVVNRTVINPVAFTSYWAPINLDGANDKIPGLALGRIDPNGGAELFSFPLGPIYDGLAQLASDQAEGFKLYLESAQYSTGTYVLRFATYRGKNRTRDQIGTSNLMVRFAPQLDSLSGVKEINSYSEFKNTVYVFYKNQVSVHYIPTLPSTPLGFDRRAIMVDAPDIFLNPGDIPAFRAQVARDALASHLYIQAVDGQVSSKNDYVFERDYYLGDIIELEGFSGRISKARVTEYIRSQDQFGEQEYPTLSVIDPLGTYYGIPDTENTDYIPDWVGEDPTWTDDWTTPDTSVPPDITVDPLDPRLTRVPPLDNPLDPYDFNPDPIPDFGAFDDGSVNSDTSGDQGLTPGTVFGGTDWLYDSTFGYYVHSGTVYVAGEASADGYGHSGSTLLLSGIPPELAPATSLSRRVLIDHVNSTSEYAYDSGLSLGPWLDVTINPSGTVTLDAGNPYRPVDNTHDYSQVVLVLSSLSWPTASAIPDTYAPTGSLDDYIATAARIGSGLPAWTNVDGSYTAHGSRLHLKGKIKAADLGAQFPALVGIPPTYQPTLTSGPIEHHWCEVPQKDGYRFTIKTPDLGRDQPLESSSGAQNPQGSGNGGCGILKELFYSRNSDGFLTRGSSPALSFTPGTHDVGLAWQGCSGNPIGSMPAVADWRGMLYSVSLAFAAEDLSSLGGSVSMDFIPELDGPHQVSFIVGISPEISSYYKIVLWRDGPSDLPPTPDMQFYLILFLVGSGGEPLYKTAIGFPPPALNADGRYHLSWNFKVSTSYTDVGVLSSTGARDYFTLDGSGGSSDVGVSEEGDVTAPSLGGKGHMGIHLPPGSSTAQILSANIFGLGDFPRYAPGDEIDLTGCGWPLT